MSGSYRQCVECGKRALKFATRCPGCGIELPNPAPLERGAPRLSRSDPFKGVMAVMVIGGAIVSFQRIPSRPAPLSAETPVIRSGIVKQKPAVVDTTTAAAPAAAPVQRIAKGWTRVRRRPNDQATLEAVLTPGDTVTADSLAHGWYRVALYGDVLGYAREITLAPAGPQQ